MDTIEQPSPPPPPELGDATPQPARRARATRRHHAPMAVACLILGALCAVQWKIRHSAETTQESQPNRADILAEQLADTEAKTEQMRAEIERLRNETSRYQKAAAEGETLAKQMNEALQRAKVAAGLTPVKGPGLLVTLEDAPRLTASAEDQSPYVIHDIDLLQVVNELWTADAEAIAINGQRLTMSSEIRCSGNVIKVNDTPITPPYDVRAIGDPKTLQGALELPGGVLDVLRPFRIRARMTLKSEVELPAADVAQSFKHL